ncbi:hypothetical protein, partial [Staphylococcus aureus]
KEELESHQGRSQTMRNAEVEQAKPLNHIMSNLVYALTKEAARTDFMEFLESWGVTYDEYL